MIVSHSNKFIFVKIPKTAGESLVSLLQPYADMNMWNSDRGNHEKIQEVKKELPPQDFEDYYKFAVVRNPWSLRVSRYFYLKEIEIPRNRAKGDLTQSVPGSFKEWNIEGNWFPNSQYAWICDETGNSITDFVIRFENLQEDFNIVCDKIKIPRQELPHKNKSKHKHYTEYYDEEIKSMVAEKYKKDIEYFGYEFGYEFGE
tara:strand:+ start:4022 stop:4624 length:603 start_codon:yes stop_codon:yes gene_type:complete